MRAFELYKNGYPVKKIRDTIEKEYSRDGNAAAEERKETHEPHQHRHLEYAKIKNPVAMTAQSIAEGKKLFEKHCISCHGKTEKGGIGPDLKGSLRIHGNSDGEIFHIITAGVKGTVMKGFKNELSDEMRWHLVNYISSLKAKSAK